MKTWMNALRLVLAALWLLTCWPAHAADAPAQIVLAGAVKTPLTLSLADLKAFPPDQIGTLTVTRKVDDKDVASSVRGVRLTALLERAVLADPDHNAWKHTLVLATAADGYRVVFSVPELTNTDIGSAVLVVFERDGQPLTAREGPLALVSARDTRSGPRSVKWLVRLDVKVVRD